MRTASFPTNILDHDLPGYDLYSSTYSCQPIYSREGNDYIPTSVVKEHVETEIVPFDTHRLQMKYQTTWRIRNKIFKVKAVRLSNVPITNQQTVKAFTKAGIITGQF